MRAIDRTLVDEVWRELTAYAPARVASEAQAFLDLQPHAAAFSQSLTRQFDPTVQKAALGLAFLVLRARYLAPMASALNLSSVHFLPFELCASLVAGGIIVGCLGGLVAAWKPQ